MEGSKVASDCSHSSGADEGATTERAVAELWKEVLGLPESPGPNDNFFDLGGDSTAMVMAELRIRDEFSVELPLGAMLNAPSLRELARVIEAAAGGPV